MSLSGCLGWTELAHLDLWVWSSISLEEGGACYVLQLCRTLSRLSCCAETLAFIVMSLPSTGPCPLCSK